MKIKILYEDSNILVIDKPAGILVHPVPEQARYGAGPDRKTKEESITKWFVKKYPKSKNVGEKEAGVIRPGVVHRLDRETSGVLLLAKNQKAHEFLKKQFMDREVKKTYVAIVSGHVKEDRGVINKGIGRSPKDFRRYLAGRGARGEIKDAITQFRVLKRIKVPCVQNFSGSSLKGSHANKNFKHTAPFTYLEIHPKTGRTHQIRVHMKYKNHPVACDLLYDPDGVCPKGIKRLALHAKSIEFRNLKGDILKVESPIPKEFA